MTAFAVVIPARFGSTRLPGKPLLTLAGLPMIQWVYRRGVDSEASVVVVATDDLRIRRVAEGFGARVVMTREDHPSGTDRCAEVVEALGWPDDGIVVNLQGDEPLMPPVLLRQVAELLAKDSQAALATLSTPIVDIEELFDPNVVKVVTDGRGRAQYFSRAPIPHHRQAFGSGAERPAALPAQGLYRRHLGLYAYRVGVLKDYPTLPPSPLEAVEALEQLRALWHGLGIAIAEAVAVPPLGVDTGADLARATAALAREGM